MRERTTAALAGLLLLGSTPLHAQTVRDWTEEQSAIVDLIQRSVAANNAGDVEAWVALFADDAVYMPPGSPAVTTRQGLREVAEAGFRHAADIWIEPDEIVVTGTWAYARSRVGGTVTVHPTGEVITVDVKQLVIYRRTETGDWRIVQLITNSNS